MLQEVSMLSGITVADPSSVECNLERLSLQVRLKIILAIMAPIFGMLK